MGRSHVTIEVFRAAKHLGRLSGWKLSNLEMQKLIYLAHMIHLGQAKRPLVHGDFEAWELGPVHPDLYHFLKSFGASPVTNRLGMFDYFEELSDGEEMQVLDNGFQAFPSGSGAKLVHVTHSSPSAWLEVYEPGVRGIKIRKELIIEEYRKRFNEK